MSWSALSSACAPLGLLLPGLLGCGEQGIRVVERAPAPSSSDRGRVQVRDGNLVTDKGTRLRGVTFGLDAAPETTELDAALVTALTEESGLNALHVYLENYRQESGSHAARADELVELAAEAGAYIIIGIGGGDANGSFYSEKVQSFWEFYAPRYAERTHVIYEIQNIPENSCDPLAPSTLEMEREAYATIREVAPSTHVALFTFGATPTLEQVDGALDGVAELVDWSKASLTFHDDDRCVAAADRPLILERLRERGVASFASELRYGAPASDTLVLEAQRSGWMSFSWLVRSRDLAAFRAEHAAAGVSWCPDFGSWPQDAEKCTAP